MRKVLSVIVVILGGLMALGGLIIPGLLVAGAGVWIWPFRKKVAENTAPSSAADPLWARTDRESLYYDYEEETTGGDDRGDSQDAPGNGDGDGGSDFGDSNGGD
ncbi:MAG: hypothetical protein D6681_22845 [Calditrichaeota bacterium]|nr:MAG: hypothetical protein D6681_22845 [Calditrichota bacterium]